MYTLIFFNVILLLEINFNVKKIMCRVEYYRHVPTVDSAALNARMVLLSSNNGP